MPYVELTHSYDLFYGLFRKGWKKLTIVPNVSDASVSFVATIKVIRGNSIWVPSGTIVGYTVEAPSYESFSSTVQVNDDMTINVNLVDQSMLRVCGAFYCGTNPL